MSGGWQGHLKEICDSFDWGYCEQTTPPPREGGGGAWGWVDFYVRSILVLRRKILRVCPSVCGWRDARRVGEGRFRKCSGAVP